VSSLATSVNLSLHRQITPIDPPSLVHRAAPSWLRRAELALLWVLVCALLWPVSSTILTISLGTPLTAIPGGPSIAWRLALSALVAGLALGTAQWAILRQQRTISRWWIAATAAGWLLALPASTLGQWLAFWLVAPSSMSVPFPPPMSFQVISGFLTGGMLGVIVGSAQWFVLRRHMSASSWWIIAATAGWIVGSLLSKITPVPALPLSSSEMSRFIGALPRLAIAGAAYGAFTWAALSWLVQTTRTKQ